jgi:hypothetical protein
MKSPRSSTVELGSLKAWVVGSNPIEDSINFNPLSQEDLLSMRVLCGTDLWYPCPFFRIYKDYLIVPVVSGIPGIKVNEAEGGLLLDMGAPIPTYHKELMKLDISFVPELIKRLQVFDLKGLRWFVDPSRTVFPLIELSSVVGRTADMDGERRTCRVEQLCLRKNFRQ